jgi:DNA-binding response OmpR family regulator
MKNVLIMEEDGEGREALASVLKKWGFHVHQAANAESALAELESDGAIDLVIAGATEQDRTIFLADVRDCCPKVPVLFLADYCNAEARLRKLLFGAFAASRKHNYYLNVRPISLYELDRLIRIILGRRRHRPYHLTAA